MSRRRLLIVFHTQSGRSEQLALAAFRGASSEGEVEVRLQRAIDASSADLLWANALLLVTPENFGTTAGGMKDLLDRIYYPCERAGLAALPYALIISAGNSGTGCDNQLSRILQAMRMKKVQETLLVLGNPREEDLAQAGELGMALAIGLAAGIF